MHRGHGAVSSDQEIPFKGFEYFVFAYFGCHLHLVASLWLVEVCDSVVEVNDAFIWERMQQGVMNVAPMCAAEQPQLSCQFQLDSIMLSTYLVEC